MYKIIKDGALVGIASAPTYIKMQENGCYGLCSREQAQGIAFDGKPYQLADRAEMGGLEVVTMAEENDATITSDHTAAAHVFVQQVAAGNIDEETALEHKGLFDEWQTNTDYAVDEVVRHSDRLFRCLQAHTSQAEWTPDAVPALWVEIAPVGEYREIKANMLPTEAFALDEIGWYQSEDNLYKSLIDANTYTPETYPAGWEQVTG